VLLAAALNSTSSIIMPAGSQGKGNVLLFPRDTDIRREHSLFNGSD
jgi:hypothetical protein